MGSVATSFPQSPPLPIASLTLRPNASCCLLSHLHYCLSVRRVVPRVGKSKINKVYVSLAPFQFSELLSLYKSCCLSCLIHRIKSKLSGLASRPFMTYFLPFCPASPLRLSAFYFRLHSLTAAPADSPTSRPLSVLFPLPGVLSSLANHLPS